MLHAHNLVPLGFTDREHRLGSRVRVAEQDYVQLVANLASRVEADIAKVRLIGEQVPGLAKQRARPVENGPQHPRIEVARPGGRVTAGKLPAVRRVPPTMAWTLMARSGSVMPQNCAVSG
jgi:hypothetical protein